MSDQTYIQTSQLKNANEVRIQDTMGSAVPRGPVDQLGDPDKKQKNDFLMGVIALGIAFYIGRKFK